MRPKTLSRFALTAFFIAAGLNHFLSTEAYRGMMPPLLPWPIELIWVSGAMEILGGLGTLVARTRRFAGWGLILLLLAVFPANIHAAIHGFNGGLAERVILVLRLPFQAVMIYWVYQCCVGTKPATVDLSADHSKKLDGELSQGR